LAQPPPGALDTVCYATVLAHSFAVKYPYDISEALKDLPGITYALDIFLASHMFEAEDYCHKSDPKKYVGHLK
jgi:hypothetical protein